MKKIILCLFVFVMHVAVTAQSVTVYPTNWWVGMKWNKVQLLIKAQHKNIAQQKIVINYPGVSISRVHKFDNAHYVALDVNISSAAKPGTVKISIGNEVINWPLSARRKGNGTLYANGTTAADLIYLIMPDRFSNGDESNDRIVGMKDQTHNRDTVFNRHGGDLKGIQNHLDYLQDLGVTTLWLNPVIENDMPNRTEHGYAFTDHYKIERRIGGAQAYKNLVDAVHARGMKLIQDAVYNHVGIDHILYREQPDSTWFHRWKKFTQTNYKDQTVFDPYAAKIDKKIMADGWFTTEMPDWDQSNLFVQNFLIQHALWTVEEFGIDGWRIDTYAYNDLNFMNRCNKALYDEYPKLSLFGETWVHGVINQSYFCENNYSIPFKSNLQATTDFQLLFYGIQAALTEPFGWTNGVNKLYSTAAQDFVYKDPTRQVIFLDNHDLSRFYSIIKEDTAKYKSALAWLLTYRGTPQLYYGNEILMAGETSPNDGYVRLDFPGGWKGDKQNKFTASGRTKKENNVFNYLKTLANFRKTSSAITTGKMMQFLPIDGVYVYFRYDNKQTIMCAMNTNDKASTIDMARFTERLQGFTTGKEIVSGAKIKLGATLTLHANSTLVLELER